MKRLRLRSEPTQLKPFSCKLLGDLYLVIIDEAATKRREYHGLKYTKNAARFSHAAFTTFGGGISSSVLNTQSQKRLVTPNPFW